MFRRFRPFLLLTALCGTASVTIACGLAPTNPPEKVLTSKEKAALHGARTLLIVETVVDEAHRVQWSAPLREAAEKCNLPTRAEILACLDPYTPDNNAKVVAALEAYSAAATLAGAAVVNENASPDVVRESIVTLTREALSVVELIPKASSAAATLKQILETL